MARMKLILTQEVGGLGAPGDVVDVAAGYGRNYLLPRGFGIAWTRGGEKQVDLIKRARAAREIRTMEDAQAVAGRLPGVVTGGVAPPLPVPAPIEAIADDLWSLGVTPERTAIELLRPELDARGVVPASALPDAGAGRVTVAGVVTHRQQPDTARGAVFLNLEDETGMVNVVCSRGAWVRWWEVARRSPALVVRGRLERSEGVVNVVAERFEPLVLGPAPGSRDFR